MSEQRRLGRDPLEELLAADPSDSTRPEAADTSPGRRGGARITVQVHADLAGQVRDAVMWLHKVDVHTTISAIAEAGLRTELKRLAVQHRGGERFPPRSGKVPTGRPPAL